MDPNLDAIAFLYLTVAHTADGAVSGDEMRSLANGVRAWDPEASLESIGEVLKRTVERYKQLPSTDERLAEADRLAKSIGPALAAEDRARVLEGLRTIAAADGQITDDETAVIERIGRALG